VCKKKIKEQKNGDIRQTLNALAISVIAGHGFNSNLDLKVPYSRPSRDISTAKNS